MSVLLYSVFLKILKHKNLEHRDVLNGDHCEQHQKVDKPSLCMTGSVMMKRDKACDCHIL